MNWFKKLDAKLIKSRPVAWILGVHIFIPVLILEALILFIIGYVNGFDPEYSRDYKAFYSLISWLVTMLSIAFIVIYFIRQVRFNTVRIHHHLPFKRFMLFFAVFYFIMLGFIFMPFMANYGAYTKVYQETAELRALHSQHIDEWGSYELEGVDSETQSLLYMIKYNRYSFFCAEWKFIEAYSLLALAFSMMLIGISATSVKDFGWSMLINVLIPITFGILVAIVATTGSFQSSDEESTILTLMTLIAIIVGLLAVPRKSNDRSKSFALSFYFYSPLLIISYLLSATSDLDIDDWPIGITYVTVIVATILFGVYAKRRALNPE